MEAQTPPVPKPAAGNHDPLNRNSPQSSVFSFLEACRAKDYQRAWRYLDLRILDDDNKRAANGPELAQQLQQVLDRDPRFDVAALSTSPDGEKGDSLAPDRDLVDTFNVDGKPQQLVLQRLPLRSGLQVWLFAPDSIALIPKLAAISSGSPVEKYLPALLVSWKVMDTPLWRFIAMILIALVLAAASRWISRLALWFAEVLVKRTRLKINKNLPRSFSAPIQLILPVAIFRGALPALGLAALLRLGAERVCEFLLIAGGAWLCMRAVDAFITGLQAMLAARKSSFPYSTLSLTSRILKLAIFAFALTALQSATGVTTRRRFWCKGSV